MRKMTFDTSVYPFHEIIAEFIGTEDLASIEAYFKEGQRPKDDNSIYKNMEQTLPYIKLYAHLEAAVGRKFYTIYEDFIRHVIRPLYPEPIYYQKKPTHRIHFRNSSGASRFHKDTDYGHNSAEVNYSVPQTPMFDTNSIWIESEEDKGDFSPIELAVGEYVEFNGAELKHGAKQNTTDQTRVSFDFRVMPESEVPEVVTDKTNWEEKANDNALTHNAHTFALCE